MRLLLAIVGLAAFVVVVMMALGLMTAKTRPGAAPPVAGPSSVAAPSVAAPSVTVPSGAASTAGADAAGISGGISAGSEPTALVVPPVDMAKPGDPPNPDRHMQ